MIVDIIYDEENNPIGWEMSGENPDEIKKLRAIRDLQFFGLEETAIEYSGRRLTDDKNCNPGILSWKQEKYIN